MTIYNKSKSLIIPYQNQILITLNHDKSQRKTIETTGRCHVLNTKTLRNLTARLRKILYCVYFPDRFKQQPQSHSRVFQIDNYALLPTTLIHSQNTWTWWHEYKIIN